MSDEFRYTYSAPTEEEKREARDIRNEYMPVAQKVAALKKLHRRIKRPPRLCLAGLIVLGVLIFGLGLTLCLEWGKYLAGILVAAAGIPFAAAAYPVYGAWLRARKKKYAEEVLRLSDEILKESE